MDGDAHAKGPHLWWTFSRFIVEMVIMRNALPIMDAIAQCIHDAAHRHAHNKLGRGPR